LQCRTALLDQQPKNEQNMLMGCNSSIGTYIFDNEEQNNIIDSIGEEYIDRITLNDK